MEKFFNRFPVLLVVFDRFPALMASGQQKQLCDLILQISVSLENFISDQEIFDELDSLTRSDSKKLLEFVNEQNKLLDLSRHLIPLIDTDKIADVDFKNIISHFVGLIPLYAVKCSQIAKVLSVLSQNISEYLQDRPRYAEHLLKIKQNPNVTKVFENEQEFDHFVAQLS